MIPGSGMGLWADEHMRRGDLIVEVTGEKYAGDSDVELANDLYLLDSGDGTDDYIDVKGPAMYANDACGLVRLPGMVNNSLFRLMDDCTLWLEATRAIHPGQEILASYGRAYWTAIKAIQKESLSAEAVY